MWLLMLVAVVAVAAGLSLAAKGVIRVPKDHVGVVYRQFGGNHRGDDFKVRVHGSIGPQAAVLAADRVYWLPPWIYSVRYVPETYVPPGTIGVVVARVGSPPPAARTLCEPVDCDYFQDGRAFLLAGGQMGRQPGILPGGASYDINPEIFEVLTVATIGEGRHDLTAADLREVAVPEGSAGVVIALEGAAPQEDGETVRPKVPGHENFQNIQAFLANGGQRGAQAEPLGGGLYRINPWFARIVLIPTRVLILQWTNKAAKSASNYDSSLDRIRINVEGYWLRFDMSQTIQISPKSAPRLVARFGEQEVDKFGFSEAANPTPVQRFVERVLKSTVEGYFQATASKYEVLDFITAHDEVCLELAGQVRQALADWGVEAVETTLGEFEPENDGLDLRRIGMATQRDRKQELEFRYENALVEERIEQKRLETEERRRQLETVELAEQIRLLGREPVALKGFLQELKDMKVPDFIGGDAGQLLQHLPFAMAVDMVHRAMGRATADDPHPAVLAQTSPAPLELELPPGWRTERNPAGAVHDWTEEPVEAVAPPVSGQAAPPYLT